MTNDQLSSPVATELIRLTTAGSVDDGKSTLIGRLLHDTGSVYEDQWKKDGEMGFADLLDGLKDEQEQGITIDVAYRYFSTQKRRFIIADSPGHEQYTRNMITAASTADLAIVLVDARKGMTTQSKRHLFLVSMMGIAHVLVVVNKMDLVDYDQRVFEAIQNEITSFSAKLTIPDLQFMPISALNGDMITKRGSHMNWYEGHTVLSFLESLQVAKDRNLIDFRFPVQMTIRHQDFRGYAGRLESGAVRKGEAVTILPSGQSTRIKGIYLGDKELEYAFNPQSVLITLEDEVDVGRGSMIVRERNQPESGHGFEAMLSWFASKPMKQGVSYLMKSNYKTTRCQISDMQYRLNINTLHRETEQSLSMNEIGKVTVSASQPLLFDAYEKSRNTGSFVLIDETTNQTVAAGIVLKKTEAKKEFTPVKQAPVLWFTGLSGSGKSTLANEVACRLSKYGVQNQALDGDILRQSICKDLGYSKEDRDTNIERAVAVAKLLSQNGVMVMASFISPYLSQRALAHQEIGNLIEIYLDTPLEVCEQRDVKGLYAKARTGEIEGFTGVSDPYEAPSDPDLKLNTATLSIEACADRIMDYLKQNNWI